MGKVRLLFVLFIFSVFSTSAQTNQNQFHKTDQLNHSVNHTASTDKETLIDSAPPSIIELLENKSLGDFSTGDAEIDRFLEETSVRYNIDPLLIFAQMNQESRFKLKATSYKGASGLMQLMPDTAARFGVKNIYDPQQNIEAGIKYMRWLLDKFDGDLRLALAGYNAGEGEVMKYDNQIPPYRETQNYVARILAHYKQITKQASATIVDKIIEQEAVAAVEEIS